MQEKDPTADEAFAAAKALQQQSMQSAAGDQSAAQAVDGFVPKARPTIAFKAKANNQSQSSRRSDGQAAASTSLSAKGKRPVAQGQFAAGGHEGADGPHPRASSGSNAAAVARPVSEASISAQQVDTMSQQMQAASVSEESQGLESGSQQHLSSSTSLAVPADAPIIEFEIDDAEGPLEGAANDLSSRFGRLKVSPHLGAATLCPHVTCMCTSM